MTTKRDSRRHWIRVVGEAEFHGSPGLEVPMPLWGRPKASRPPAHAFSSGSVFAPVACHRCLRANFPLFCRALRCAKRETDEIEHSLPSTSEQKCMGMDSKSWKSPKTAWWTQHSSHIRVLVVRSIPTAHSYPNSNRLWALHEDPPENLLLVKRTNL